MDTILVRERYKVVQVLTVQENYAFVEAVDILDREKTSYLLNIYEGPLLRTYLPCFDQLKTCSDFEGTSRARGEATFAPPSKGKFPQKGIFCAASTGAALF